MTETKPTVHRMYVDKIGSQQFVAGCSCGWKGQQKNGRPFWSKGAAGGAILAHQKESGLPLSLAPGDVGYVESYTDGRKR